MNRHQRHPGMLAALSPTMAHLGGIDEVGVFLVPTVLAVVALRWAERRARRQQAQDEPAEGRSHDADTG